MASMLAFHLVTASFVKETRKAVTQLKKKLSKCKDDI